MGDFFNDKVKSRFSAYSGLLRNLPYDKTYNTSFLIDSLREHIHESVRREESPDKILHSFFEKHFSKDISTQEKLDFLFRCINFIERQVVLFDSVEDAFFEENRSNYSTSFKNLKIQVDNAHKTSELIDLLGKYSVRLVFTAHPTQFYPHAVLRISQELQAAIKKNDLDYIRDLLIQLGKTPLYQRQKPSPYDEAMSVLFYLRFVYYSVLKEIHKEIEEQLGIEIASPLVEMGFWPGGDRDGNPFVTAEMTLKVARALKTEVLKCYYHHLKAIRRRLTFRYVDEILKNLSDRLYENMFDPKDDFSPEDVLTALHDSKKIIVEQHNGLFVHLLDELILQVKCFGFYFASLDIRQDSSAHISFFNEIHKIKNSNSPKTYSDLTIDEKFNFLENLSITISEEQLSDPLSVETLRTPSVIEKIQRSNGEKGCYRYIISNTHSYVSVLEVMKLFEICGYHYNKLHVDIVPLFETIDALQIAHEVMEKLWRYEKYKIHLEQRGNKQYVMLGFSDGTKDGGYFKANWEIYSTKIRLSELARKHGIKIIFFDGRGGPPARGGGKTHQFYASQSPKIELNQIQLTIQGQTISSMFGSHQQAKFNFQQLLTSGLFNKMHLVDTQDFSDDEFELVTEVANNAFNSYCELKNHPLFTSYMEDNTPIKYYGMTNIASRPTKRNSGDKLQLTDLRAIPFVSSWGQIKQNISGYYGLGSALNVMKKNRAKWNTIKKLYAQNLFFRTLLQNSMMALSKTDFDLTAFLKNDHKYGDFYKQILKEFELTKSLLLEISGLEKLELDDAYMNDSIRFREDLIKPLVVIQQFALQSLRTSNNEITEDIIQKLVIRSMIGNINASRNSA